MNKDEYLEALFKAETADEVDEVVILAGKASLPPAQFQDVVAAGETRKAAIGKRHPVPGLGTSGAPEGSLDETIDQEGKAVVDAVREEAEKKFPVVVQDASALWNVPPGFIILFDDKPYVTKEGMLWKLREYGYHAVSVEILEDDEQGGFRAEAKIFPKLARADYDLLSKVAENRPEDLLKVMEELRRPTTGNATANKKNLKPNQLKYAREMAETRATLRAARVYTGMGLSQPPEEEKA